MQVEAMRYALKQLNQKIKLLHGWQFRYWIVDSCLNRKTLQRFLTDYSDRWFFFHAAIGPPTTDEMLLLSAAATLSSGTLVSPSVTSSIFDARNDHENAFRTVPSNAIEVIALIDICLHFRWTYVSIVSSSDRYGKTLREEFINQAKKNSICIKKQIKLANTSPSECKRALSELLKDGSAKVVFLFTGQVYTQAFLNWANINGHDDFTWVTTTSWPPSNEFVKNMKGTAKGSLILSHSDVEDRDFKNYFLKLSVKEANYTWFREFWEEIFNCRFSNPSFDEGLCTGKEKLDESLLDWEFLPIKPIINAAESIACALQRALSKYCHRTSYYCPVYSSTMRKEAQEIFKTGRSKCESFTYSVDMNKAGYYGRNITILNFDGEKHKKVGTWRYVP